MERYFKYIYFFIFSLSLLPLSAQELLFSEDFNQCAVPSDWIANISYGEGVGFYVGQPTNDNSDSTSIDGSCMMVFDDDILGNNTPTFVAEVSTPSFSTMGYNTVRLHTDISFRAYGTSTLSVYIEESDGQRILLTQYGEGQETGSQFSDFAQFSLDLSFFTTSQELKIIYVYDDDEMYAWYAGIDNVEVIGDGEGEIIIIEQFNECGLPENWTTNILEGDQDWTFGFFDNENSASTSMNNSCFAFFDDDGIGNEAPYSTADLMTPWFDGSQYATFILELELIFRRYGDFENISVLVNDGENIKLVKEFFDAVGGPQITNYLPVQIDLTEYRSNNMQIIFRYDDGNEWGWWTGLDNVKVIGNGSINDLCENYETLEIGKACRISDNKNAIFSGPPNSCFSNGEGSLWYALVAPQDGILRIENESNYNDLISIYSGQCDALVEISCTNRDEHGFQGEVVVFNATKDQMYFVRISGISSDYGLSRGRNCIEAQYINQTPQASEEDIIGMAVPLSINSEALSINNAHGNIETNIPEDNLLARSDLWYTFQTNEYQNIKVDIVSDFAENTVVYDENFSEIHAQLEGGQFSLLGLVEDATYYIQVSGTFAIIEGNADILLSAIDAIAPESDDCFTHAALTVDNEVSYNNSGQTFSGQYSSCDIYAAKDRWFSFLSDGNLLYLNLESDFIANATIYRGECDDLVEVFCESGLKPCDGSIALGGLESGQTYYLQISASQTNNNNISGTVSLSLSSDPVELPDLSLNVSTQCLDNGFSELQILVDSDVAYTLSGNAHGDMLFEGDSYIVVATPEGGCEKSVKGVVDCQGTGCNLSVETFVSYPTCSEAGDGSIELEVENGLGPFSYAWAHSQEDVPQFESVESGEYFVTITDALGCVSSASVKIEEPNPIVSSVNSYDQMIADTNDGSASVNISGGTLPYSIEWSNGATSQSINDLAPGDYSVTITDYNGCFASHEIIVKEVICAFEVDADVTPLTCSGDMDASITITSESDIESIEWNNNESGATIFNLESGVYTAIISLSDGCQTMESYTIAEPEAISVEANITNAKCFGESNGSISPIASGGNGDFTYDWGDGSNELERTDLPEGEYVLLVTDQLGCEVLNTYFITQPDLLEVASSMVSDLKCPDSGDGQICVFVEGGTQPYQFDWEGLENGMSKMTDLVAGTYNLRVTDLNQCTLEVEQAVSAPLPIEVSVENMSITALNDGQIEIRVEGGTAPYEVTWYVNNDVVGMGTVITDLVEGIYRAVVFDANGCVFETPDYLLSPTGVEELVPSEYTVYPNPTKASFTIEVAGGYVVERVKVYAVTGQDVSQLVSFSKDGDRLTGNNVGLLSGLYYLEMLEQGGEVGARVPLIIAK